MIPFIRSPQKEDVLDKIWKRVMITSNKILMKGSPELMSGWLIRNNISIDDVNKAAQHHGYRDMSDYWNKLSKETKMEIQPGKKSFKTFISEQVFIKEHADKTPIPEHPNHRKKNRGIREETDEVDEASAFDWRNNKSEINWKDDDKEKSNDGKHKGTYGNDNHRAPSEKNQPIVKKAVGRPQGYVDKEYKARDPSGKAASLAKSMASKAEGLAVRKEYKAGMDAAIRKRQIEIYQDSLKK